MPLTVYKDTVPLIMAISIHYINPLTKLELYTSLKNIQQIFLQLFLYHILYLFIYTYYDIHNILLKLLSINTTINIYCTS